MLCGVCNVCWPAAPYLLPGFRRGHHLVGNPISICGCPLGGGVGLHALADAPGCFGAAPRWSWPCRCYWHARCLPCLSAYGRDNGVRSGLDTSTYQRICSAPPCSQNLGSSNDAVPQPRKVGRWSVGHVPVSSLVLSAEPWLQGRGEACPSAPKRVYPCAALSGYSVYSCTGWRK